MPMFICDICGCEFEGEGDDDCCIDCWWELQGSDPNDYACDDEYGMAEAAYQAWMTGES